MARVRQSLGVSESLPLQEAVEQAHRALKMSSVEGSLAEQVDKLYNTLFAVQPTACAQPVVSYPQNVSQQPTPQDMPPNPHPPQTSAYVQPEDVPMGMPIS